VDSTRTRGTLGGDTDGFEIASFQGKTDSKVNSRKQGAAKRGGEGPPKEKNCHRTRKGEREGTRRRKIRANGLAHFAKVRGGLR